MDSKRTYSANYKAVESEDVDDKDLFLNWMDAIEQRVYEEKHIYLSQIPIHIMYRLAFEDGCTTKVVVEYILKVS